MDALHFPLVQLFHGKVQQLLSATLIIILSVPTRKRNLYMNSARVSEVFPRFHITFLFQLLILCYLKVNLIRCQAMCLSLQTIKKHRDIKPG